jgi:hypothetical protein
MNSTPPIHEREHPPDGRAPHPLFPLPREAVAEIREIAFVTFQRRCPDGRTDNCPEDYHAREIRSWSDVAERWGCGEYRVIGKDSLHRVVARYPTAKDQWVRCDHASTPFMPREVSPYTRRVATRLKLPRLRGTSGAAIALWALLCAERAEREAAAVAPGTHDYAFLHGCAAANRRLARSVLRMLAARALTKR